MVRTRGKLSRRGSNDVPESSTQGGARTFFTLPAHLWETDYRICFIHCETDSVIRFLKKFANFFRKRITESVSYTVKRIL